MSTGPKRTAELLEQFINSKRNLADTLVGKGEVASFNEPFDTLVQKAGDYIPKSFIFVDGSGNEMAGVLVDQKTIFDATENDVREGKVFASELGVKTGTKFIPSYVVREGYRAVTSGSPFVIPLAALNGYDYTKIQVIISPYNQTVADSVAAEKIAIDSGVYKVMSNITISTISKDTNKKQIDLGIVNDKQTPYLMRYFTYKEIY